jgi:hypothetical protein
MTDTQSTTSTAVTDDAIDAETNRIIAATCVKHGIQPSDLPPGAADDARRAAKEMLQADAAQKANPLYTQLQAEREAHRLTQMTLEAVKQTRVGVANDVKPVAFGAFEKCPGYAFQK